MYKKLIVLTSAVFVLGFVNVSAVANVLWSGAGDDNLWTNPANWEGNKVPGPSDWVNIEAPGAVAPDGPVIQDGMDLQIDGMSNELPGEPTLTITGGSLTISGWGIWWGDAADCSSTCYMSGGTVTLTGGPGIHEFGWGGASGKWIMTGGTVNAKGVVLSTDPGNTGELYLHGGTYNIGTARADRSDRHGGGLLMNDGGLIDITEGTLVLEALEGEENRYMQYLEDLMAAGQITAYGGAGEFDMDFDGRNPGKITLTAVEAGKAYKPDPADGKVYEDTWASLSWSPADAAVSHDLYFGENLDEVVSGAGDTYRGNQGDTFYIVGFPGYPYPDGLVPGTTYYWRVDEVEADGTINRGDVWSFTIPPKTAFNPSPADGAEFVDQNVELSWTPGYGAMLHTVYFGDNYDDVSSAAGGTSQGTATHTPGPLDPEKVYYWRVDEFDGTDTYKGQVWAFSTPGAVGNPNPANGATGVQMNAVLSWTPGDSATSSDVYFGTDKDAVRNATTASSQYKGNKPLGSETHDPGKLAWHSAYYWRVDGIGANTYKGNVWSFETADYITVDDFESYNDLPEEDPNSNRIYLTWIDGFGTTTNGSVVGYADLPLTEHGDVHSGSTSMPYSYDNDGKYSEANMTLDYPRDWTEEGVGVLSLWFKGNASNAAEQMYVILNGTAAVYHDDPAAAQIDEWTRWTIDLQEFADQGVDLTNVNSVGIGFGDENNVQSGGSGKMLFDDIALYRPAATPADPSLVARWLFDEDSGDTATDSSGNGHDGAAVNGASISGGALVLNGTDQYVEVAHDPALNLAEAFTITALVQLDANDDRRPIITKEQMPHGSRGWNCWIQDGEPRMQLMDGVKWADTGDVNQSKLTVQSGTTLEAAVPYHLAFVYDSAGPEQIYVDGILQVSEDVVTGTLHVNEQPVRIGAYIWDPAGYQKYLAGSIDEIRIYNRALTEAEITQIMNGQ